VLDNATQPNPTQPNPTHTWTQPMFISELIVLFRIFPHATGRVTFQ